MIRLTSKLDEISEYDAYVTVLFYSEQISHEFNIETNPDIMTSISSDKENPPSGADSVPPTPSVSNLAIEPAHTGGENPIIQPTFQFILPAPPIDDQLLLPPAQPSDISSAHMPPAVEDFNQGERTFESDTESSNNGKMDQSI